MPKSIHYQPLEELMRCAAAIDAAVRQEPRRKIGRHAKFRVAFLRVSCIFRAQGLDLSGLETDLSSEEFCGFFPYFVEASMVSAWDCLHFAILELVRATPVKQRLVTAYRRHLAVLPEDQLPAEARDMFRHVVVCLHEVAPMRGEDAVAASVRKMSNQAAEDCATAVVEIFSLVSRHLQNTARPPAAVVQLHNEVDVETDFPAALLSRA